MDANYLKVNVYDALTEAVAAMVIAVPEDRVEFIGQYLLAYVDRKNNKTKLEKEVKISEEKYSEELKENDHKQHLIEAAEVEHDNYQAKLPRFLVALQPISLNKVDAIDKVCAFITEFLNIPAVYIAFKKVIGETEYLYYLSASPGQSHVVGNKITKLSEELAEDEIPERQGLSFNAFLLPVIPETEEEEELDENDNPIIKPTLPPPVPQPIQIENVIRDKRIKFFGIPKLGTYVAIPFSYDSYDHETGYILRPKEEDEENAQIAAKEDDEEDEEMDENGNIIKKEKPAIIPEIKSEFITKTIKQELIIAFDSIGKYRKFKVNILSFRLFLTN